MSYSRLAVERLTSVHTTTHSHLMQEKNRTGLKSTLTLGHLLHMFSI